MVHWPRSLARERTPGRTPLKYHVSYGRKKSRRIHTQIGTCKVFSPFLSPSRAGWLFLSSGSLRAAHERVSLELSINRRLLDDTLRIVLNGLTDKPYPRRHFHEEATRASLIPLLARRTQSASAGWSVTDLKYLQNREKPNPPKSHETNIWMNYLSL